MYNEEKAKSCLEMIKEQIDNFDNKANSLITIVGIIFAISLSIIQVFNQLTVSAQTEEIHTKYILLIIASIFYFISFVTELVFLVMVIYPRKKRKNGTKALTYYADVAKMNLDEIKKRLQNESSLDADSEQIKINGMICAKKHRCFTIAAWLLIPMFVFMFLLFIIAII